MIDREWYDIVLLILMVLFMALKAVLLSRESRLGWSMAVYNGLLAAVFLHSLLRPFIPSIDIPWIISLERLAICGVVIWNVYELIHARWHIHIFRRP